MTVTGDRGMKKLRKNDVIQVERRGYYRVDEEASKTGNLVLFMIPDGKSKAMSTLTGSLAHR